MAGVAAMLTPVVPVVVSESRDPPGNERNTGESCSFTLGAHVQLRLCLSVNKTRRITFLAFAKQGKKGKRTSKPANKLRALSCSVVSQRQQSQAISLVGPTTYITHTYKKTHDRPM